MVHVGGAPQITNPKGLGLGLGLGSAAGEINWERRREIMSGPGDGHAGQLPASRRHAFCISTKQNKTAMDAS